MQQSIRVAAIIQSTDSSLGLRDSLLLVEKVEERLAVGGGVRVRVSIIRSLH